MSHRIKKSPSWKAWSFSVAAIGAVFVAVVAALTLGSREEIRQQILDRDGHVLAAVATMLRSTDSAEIAPDNFEVVLHTSRLRGVVAVRLFDVEGGFDIALPYEVSPRNLNPADFLWLQEGQAVSRFHPEADLLEVFDLLPLDLLAESRPLQEIILPLFENTDAAAVGFVQYLIDGRPVQAEFAALDRTLLLQAGTALAVGLGSLIFLAAFAFSRLSQSHRALAAQTERLVQANKELSLAARTSAVGAVTSHLIHGIRNPLTGLDLFFQTRNIEELPGASPESWKQLADATYQIRQLVDDVVEVLREQDSTTSFALSLEELEAVLHEKLQAKVAAAGVVFETKREGNHQLPGHAANLLLLILINLADNALALTPKGKKIWIRLEQQENAIAFEVGDEGPGIPESIQAHLFTPGKSGRPGGTGLGLAISQRLAANLNATLQLARSNEKGTVFSLLYPVGEEAEREAPLERAW